MRAARASTSCWSEKVAYRIPPLTGRTCSLWVARQPVKTSYPPCNSTPNFISQMALHVRICWASPLGSSIAAAARSKQRFTLSRKDVWFDELINEC